MDFTWPVSFDPASIEKNGAYTRTPKSSWYRNVTEMTDRMDLFVRYCFNQNHLLSFSGTGLNIVWEQMSNGHL
jgi:hypothetical protein